MKFVDEAKITVRSGKGGNGAVSFRREKFIPKGGPDGGDGAKGGDVYLRASDKLLTLYDFRHKRLHEAKSGQGGMGSQMNGRAGDDLYVDVPVGTLVWQDGPTRLVGHQGYLAAATVGADGRPVDDDEDENEERDPFQPPKFKQFWDMDKDPDWDAVPDRAEETGSGEDTPPAAPLLLADLDAEGKTMLVAKGGRGGKGNTHFKTSTRRTPRFAQPGEPAEEKVLRLELRIMADVGLLGLPNAGKSTFLSAVSAARPKIAPYPFTTLSPNLGVLQDDTGRRLVVADIPGLIAGAHEGHGLGHTFLRHVERTRCLVHILSVEEIGPDDPWAGFALLNEELALFDPELADKPQLQVVNKIDLKTDEELAVLREAARSAGREIHFVSALRGDGLDELVAAMWRLAAEQTKERPEELEDRPEA
jgi:GTP-binding protein